MIQLHKTGCTELQDYLKEFCGDAQFIFSIGCEVAFGKRYFYSLFLIITRCRTILRLGKQLIQSLVPLFWCHRYWIHLRYWSWEHNTQIDQLILQCIKHETKWKLPKYCWSLDENVGFRFNCDSILRWVLKPRICMEFVNNEWLSWRIEFIVRRIVLGWFVILLIAGRASSMGSFLFSAKESFDT